MSMGGGSDGDTKNMELIGLLRSKKPWKSKISINTPDADGFLTFQGHITDIFPSTIMDKTSSDIRVTILYTNYLPCELRDLNFSLQRS